jgi:aryl-alcohol dehydrogenase-like predicted oxidoreductase
MRFRRLGSHGPRVSVVGIGSWAIGGPYLFGWGPQQDTDSIAAIRAAVERGVNWVDTAPVYGLGHAEVVVGEALRPWKIGEEVLVFTKCGRTWDSPDPAEIPFDLRPETIRRECDESLQRLGVERIDLLQFHWPDRIGTPIEESWAVMDDLIRAGKVRWGGVSNFDVELHARSEAVRHVDSSQPQLSMLNRGALDDVIPWCAGNGTGVIAYAPMANGLLAGRLRSADDLAPDDWRRKNPQFSEPALSRNLALVERLRAIAERLGVTLPEFAVAWAVAQPGVTCAAVGGRDVGQVEGWIGAGDVQLDELTMNEIATDLG